MNILLTSSGTTFTRKHVAHFIEQIPNGRKITHIMTGAIPSSDKQYMIDDRKNLVEMGYHIEDLDVIGKSKEELFTTLSNSDVIYVQGGNTFFLMKYLRETGCDDIIKQLVSEGKPFVGVSAGSYILCPTIEQALWKKIDRNQFGMTDFAGLNIVPFVVFAHYEEKYKALVEEKRRTCRYEIVTLTNIQAIRLQNDVWNLI